MGVSLTWQPRPAESDAGQRTETESSLPELFLEAPSPDQLLLQGVESSASLFEENVTKEGGLLGCLACGHPELYTQRDFPRTLGIIIVVLAALLAPATHYVSLAVAALLDFVLYHFSRKLVVCYLCQGQHRGFSENPRHPIFDREIEERLLYGPKAVMGKPMRPGGTAGAPDPEH